MLSRTQAQEAMGTGLPGEWYADGTVLPDYAGEGLFNLAVSLASCCGTRLPATHPELRLADGAAASTRWGAHDVIVFFLIDGLGDAFLSRHRAHAPNLWRDRAATLTSVFPSTTATAITTLMTAQPASTHGLLGWYVRDDASGAIVAPLPMRHRGGEGVEDADLLGRLLQTPPMWRDVAREVSFVTLPDLAVGAYSQHHRSAARLHTYETLDSLAWSVFRAAREPGTAKRLIYAYTPILDACGHEFGMESMQSLQVLERLDAVYAQMRRLLPDAMMVSTADHGFVDNPPDRRIVLSDHPDLYSMLRCPLSGERRAAYCHVRPEARASFGARVTDRFGGWIYAMPAAEAFASGLFGPGAAPAARARCGDWLLIPRDDWTVLDSLPGESHGPMLGVHGGLSAGEMQVPLIVSDPASPN